MPIYHIEDGKFDTFKKRVESIRRKLNKKGDTCTCKEIGVEYKKLSDGNTYKFHTMQVEGIVAFEGWNFIARIDHLNSGNIIKTISDIEIPSKYWHTEGYCDHCNTNRPRKTTYLVEKNGEFYQLGKDCVALYTNGLDIQDVCWISDFISSLDEEEEEYIEDKVNLNSITYYEVKEVLCYAISVIDRYGYVKKKDSDGNLNSNSTFKKVLDAISDRKEDASMYASEAESIIDWVRNSTSTGNYINNLRVIIEEKYITEDNIPLLVSLVPTYRKETASIPNNDYIGNVGDKLDIEVKDASLIFSSNTMYGTLYTYKALDEEGHILITRTSRYIADIDKYSRWIGVIKEHTEFKGVKQTVMYRVKFEEK